MSSDLKYYLLITFIAIAILIAGELIHKLFHTKPEYTRKLVHVIIGFIPLFYPLLFNNHLPVLALNGQLILLLLATRILVLMPSVNNVKSNAWGGYLFPFSVYLLFIAWLHFENKALYYIPILILTVSDALAALSGMIYKALHEKNPRIRFIELKGTKKTIAGSLSFLVSALIISMILLPVYTNFSPGKTIILAIAIALSGTFTEAYSKNGTDNLSVPVVAFLVLWVFGV